MIYCISDIHGCFKQLSELLNKITFTPEDELVFLGDYVDRGPNSRDVLDLLITLDKRQKCTFLRGNHEQMFLDFMKDSYMGHIFLYNGGYKTIYNFRKEEGNGFDVPEKYVKFLESTKLWYETEDYFFVHAGLPEKDTWEITEEDKQTLLWVRDEFLSSEFYWDKMIIHGHTPLGDGKVDFKDNRINIDTACVFGGKLSCLVLPTMEVIQV